MLWPPLRSHFSETSVYRNQIGFFFSCSSSCVNFVVKPATRSQGGRGEIFPLLSITSYVQMTLLPHSSPPPPPPHPRHTAPSLKTEMKMDRRSASKSWDWCLRAGGWSGESRKRNDGWRRPRKQLEYPAGGWSQMLSQAVKLEWRC